MKKYILFLLFMVSLASCSSVMLSSIQYDQLSPAKVSLPQEVKRIAIIDRLNSKTTNDIRKLPVSSSVFAESLAVGLADTEYYDEVVLCDSDISTLGRRDSILMPLEQNVIQDLSEDLNVNLIASVEHAEATVLYAQAFPIVETKAVVRLYIPGRKGVLRNISVCDTLSWQGEEGMITRDVMVADVTDFLAKSVSEQLAPYWEPAVRYYYAGGNANFRDAAFFIKKGDWDMADELWKQMLPTTKGELRLQTLYNLVLSKEMRGEMDEALKDCSELLQQCTPDSEIYKMVGYYLGVLKQRVSGQQMLNLQMQRFN